MEEQLNGLLWEHTLNIAEKALAETPHELDVQMLAQLIADRLDGGLIDTVAFYNRTGDLIFETPFNEPFTQGERVHPLQLGNAAPSPSYKAVRGDKGTETLVTIIPLRRSLEQSPIILISPARRLHPSELDAPLHTILALFAAFAISATIMTFLFTQALKRRENQFLALEASSRTSQVATVLSLAEAIARRDDYIGQHVTRVTLIAIAIAEAMNCRQREMQALICGSILHDIGKVGVADSILNKPGKLDDSETNAIKRHSIQGANIVSSLGWFSEARDIILCHHERWDGSGYPLNLSGTAIPLLARIVAVADVFDALCSERAYKAAWSVRDALTHIDRAAGTHFDPAVVTAFTNVFSRVKSDFLLATPNYMADHLKKKLNEYFSHHC